MAAKLELDVPGQGTTSALVYRAPDPAGATLILAHGAGAPQTHPFMIDMAGRIANRGIDVVTFNFLYSERGRKLPDRTGALEACWRAAIASVRARGGIGRERLFCGGKSMGGRIASHVAAAGDASIDGLVFLGYPLHPPGKPRARRDEHLPRVPCPMLFVQGSRDAFGDGRAIRALVERLPGAALHLVKGGDHSLALPKREGAGRQEAALAAAADAIAAFVRRSEKPR
ncbi:MAG: dienelactone hydrolase family protein [Labilithrix sp.]|nr:dienelactone hydrolase family protein [Labilithrix sp.]